MNTKELTLIIVMLIFANTLLANLITIATPFLLKENTIIDRIDAKIAELVRENGKRTLQDVTILTMSSAINTLTRDVVTENLLSKLWKTSENISTVSLLDPLSTKKYPEKIKIKFRKVFNIFLWLNEMNTTDLSNVVKDRALWSVKALTIFLVINNNGSVVQKKEVIESFLMEAFQNRMLNSVLFYFDAESSLNYKIFTYNPFKETDKLEELPVESSFNEIFYDKLEDLNGYPIRISQYEDVPRSFLMPNGQIHGLDGMILNVVMQKLNATYVINDISLSLKGSKNYASFLELFNGTAEISFNRRMYLTSDYNIDSFIDYVYPREIESICLLVPKALPIPHYMSLFQPFELLTWMMILITFLIFCSTWYFLRRFILCDIFNMPPLTLEDALLKTYRILLASPLTKMVSNSSERILLMSFILFTFVILSTYQTMLITFLMSPGHEKDLTFDDVLSDPNIKIVIPSNYDWTRFIGDRNIPKEVQKKMITRDTTIWKLDTSENINRSLVYAVTSKDGQLFVDNGINVRNGQPIYHLVTEGLIYSISTYHVEKDCIYEKKMSDIMQRMREAGLLHYFNIMSYYQAKKLGHLFSPEETTSNNNNKVKKVENPDKSVTFDSLKATFILLLIGNLSSIVVFIIEIYHHKYK